MTLEQLSLSRKAITERYNEGPSQETTDKNAPTIPTLFPQASLRTAARLFDPVLSLG